MSQIHWKQVGIEFTAFLSMAVRRFTSKLGRRADGAGGAAYAARFCGAGRLTYRRGQHGCGPANRGGSTRAGSWDMHAAEPCHTIWPRCWPAFTYTPPLTPASLTMRSAERWWQARVATASSSPSSPRRLHW